MIKHFKISSFILLFISVSIFSQQQMKNERIGVFDSRCVAVAYGRTSDFLNEVDSLRKMVDKAREIGNEELSKELEQQGPTMQVLMHQQVFSNASIKNILERIKDQLPELAKKNELRMIISKWEIPFNDGTFELIDITEQLVNFFEPDEQTRKIIDNMKNMQPIPIEKISINPLH